MSTNTTRLGPRVSLSTTPASATEDILFEIPSAATLDIQGGLDSTNGAYLSRVTTSTASTSFLADGELAITSLGVLQATLAYRSGSTIHTWASTGTVI